MRVATFNIQHGRPSGGGKVDLGAVVTACLGLQADVLALQEVDRGVPRSGGADLAVAVAEATGMEWVWAESMPLRGGSYGNALFVRGTIGSNEVIRLPGISSREPRTALVAGAAVGGLSLTIGAAHLGTRPPENGKQLRELIDAFASNSGPALLLGDLNRVAALVLPHVARAGMALAGGPPTFPARRPVLRIDHIAVRDGSVTAVDVVETPISDHRALVAEVSFRR
jgi:endonuclease/exonuclease/phosphatase family metal-dependent hydrolase